MDNTGLTHILEHSVLCGSKKYPVKDPFVELLKSSLNTFLNAFTFPDKTMYPCASQNDTDFKNLMSVYMDAVFYPQIYNHEEIFMQEGWHYNIVDEEEPITYNGVVYNEMKGAFSDPEQILMRKLMHSLYPNTSYGFESGGDPKYIPNLSYKQFLNFHKEYYHPSNAYIFLYGNCDMQERMNFLDEQYLSKFEYNNFDTKIKYQEPFDKPIFETGYYPLSSEDTLENKTFLSYNLVLPTTLDTKLMIAISILVSALFDNPGAPLKQALIDAKLGQDVQTLFDDSLLQPFLSIMVLNSNKEKEQEFIDLINLKLKELVHNGIDKEAFLSIINFQEFKARERGFSSRMPQGLEIEITCLSSWLYDENKPFDKLEIVKYYSELKEDINHGYFEEIIEKYFLHNTHKSYVKLIPSYTYAKEIEDETIEYLEKYKASLSKEELKDLIQKNKSLEAYQVTPSTQEELATLPKLELKDISPEPEKYNCVEYKNKYRILFSEYHTNEIAYIKYYFDISHISLEELRYVALYADLFTHLSTYKNTYKDINQFILNFTGGMGATIIPMVCQDKECKTFFRIGYSVLNQNLSKANTLILELLNEVNFKDEKRLYERLCEIKLAKEMGVANRGHIVALMRAGSYCDEFCNISDEISGIGYMDFINKIVNNFNDEKYNLIDKLEKLKNTILSKEGFTLGFTGIKKTLEEAKPIIDEFYNSLEDKSSYERYEFVKKQENEGIKAQYDVNFVARCGKFNVPFNGAMLVLNNAISLNYLWMKVRVQGGAYGCMLQIKPNGFIGFTSYRDPEISKTNQAYNDVIEYITNLSPTEEDLLKFKIGAIGNMDTVMHVSEKGVIAQQQYFSGLTYEKRKQYRTEVIQTTKEDIAILADIFKEALEENNICVIGNASKIEREAKLFLKTRNLIK